VQRETAYSQLSGLRREECLGKIAWAESHVGTASIFDKCVFDAEAKQYIRKTL
jgi:hypothetical protein